MGADGRDGEAAARRAAETAARASYGRLVALLAARTRDIAAAEDALADAFAAALRTWPERFPETGAPDRPEAWLFTAARRAIGRRARAEGVRARAAGHVALIAEELAETVSDAPATAPIPDRRLALMAVCAHPAIDPVIRSPLMLQTVLGLDAARIAAAWRVSPAAMGQRLSRAKAKIRDAGLAFSVPEGPDLTPRLADVAQAIYAAYTTGWDAEPAVPTTPAEARDSLSGEALYLGRVLASLTPDPEAKGLLALMLYCDARAAARRRPDGAFTPLSNQDPTRWRKDQLLEAEALLAEAARQGAPGRFQLEAAIQSWHCQRALAPDRPLDGGGLIGLYDRLLALAPSLGAAVARAAALAGQDRPRDALSTLDALAGPAAESYQPYWATRAEALRRLGRAAEAAAATDRALALTSDPAVAAHLSAPLGDQGPRR